MGTRERTRAHIQSLVVSPLSNSGASSSKMGGRSEAGGASCKKRLFFRLFVALIALLGLFSFYHGSLLPARPFSKAEFDAGERTDLAVGRFSISAGDADDGLYELKSIPVCDASLSELIPCLDRHLIYQMKWKFNLNLMEHYERHCPPEERRYNCLIPPPRGYKVPIKWPASRDEVWKVNIPHTHLASEKSDQNWMVVRGDKIIFPGGGTHFHHGADKYITALAKMLKFPNDNLNNGGLIRNVIDVGCGVASFGAYLLPLDIISMSIAPNDVHENQIQFALERGIPATLGVLGTMRLPYPSRSFEFAHCSRCRIDWLQRDGILLLELDRVLRPGGYFAYSSPEAYAKDEENLRIWNAMSDLLRRMCWRVAAKRNQTVIWVKPTSNSCYNRRTPGTLPPLCGSDVDPDASWQVPMKACITPYSKRMHQEKGSGLVPWPQRLSTPPLRLQELHINSDAFFEDMEVWHRRVVQYWQEMKHEIETNTLRNIMDMNAKLGGFAAALKEKDVWVMNVVPANQSDTLRIIYDRGLIGTVHDWCQSFSTYPRTYDLLHAWDIFSKIENQRCSITDLLIEMDRILRPSGFVIIRDKASLVDNIRGCLTALHWDGWSVVVEPGMDALSQQDERLLIARKKIFQAH